MYSTAAFTLTSTKLELNSGLVHVPDAYRAVDLTCNKYLNEISPLEESIGPSLSVTLTISWWSSITHKLSRAYTRTIRVNEFSLKDIAKSHLSICIPLQPILWGLRPNLELKKDGKSLKI